MLCCIVLFQFKYLVYEQLFIIASKSDPRISCVFSLILFNNLVLCVFHFDCDDRILALAIFFLFFSLDSHAIFPIKLPSHFNLNLYAFLVVENNVNSHLLFATLSFDQWLLLLLCYIRCI